MLRQLAHRTAGPAGRSVARAQQQIRGFGACAVGGASVYYVCVVLLHHRME